MTRTEKAELEINSTMLELPNGKMPMDEAIKQVKQKVAYYNLIEVLKKKDNRNIGDTTEVKSIIHDFGFIFADGTEIRHVSKKVFDYVNVEIIMRRERK